jgi:hypothetical protein
MLNMPNFGAGDYNVKNVHFLMFCLKFWNKLGILANIWFSLRLFGTFFMPTFLMFKFIVKVCHTIYLYIFNAFAIIPMSK